MTLSLSTKPPKLNALEERAETHKNNVIAHTHDHFAFAAEEKETTDKRIQRYTISGIRYGIMPLTAWNVVGVFLYEAATKNPATVSPTTVNILFYSILLSAGLSVARLTTAPFLTFKAFLDIKQHRKTTKVKIANSKALLRGVRNQAQHAKAIQSKTLNPS